MPLTALSRSASEKTIWGDFPPSSRLTDAKFSALLRTIVRAVSGPPVKATRRTSGCLVSSCPTGCPGPVTMFTTPGGIPACSTSFPNSRIGTEPCSDGFMTTAFPAARAGASFTARSICGEFQGTMATTTPMGSLYVKISTPSLSLGSVCPWILSARPP